MYELIIISAVMCVTAAILYAIDRLTSRLKDICITVKVYHSDKTPPTTTERVKPPTIHLTDKEIKARREALKE